MGGDLACADDGWRVQGLVVMRAVDVGKLDGVDLRVASVSASGGLEWERRWGVRWELHAGDRGKRCWRWRWIGGSDGEVEDLVLEWFVVYNWVGCRGCKIHVKSLRTIGKGLRTPRGWVVLRLT